MLQPYTVVVNYNGEYFLQRKTHSENKREEEEEEMVPVDLSLEAKETVKTHLCLCAWQQADLVYTQPRRPNNIFQRR